MDSIEQATAALRDGALEACIALARKHLAQFPDSARAYYVTGEALLRGSRARLAIFNFKQALKCGHDPFQCLTRIGDSYAALGELGAAEESYAGALSVRPDWTGINIRRLNLCSPIPANRQTIEADRDRLDGILDDLERQLVKPEHPDWEIASPGYFMLYHGEMNTPWRSRLANWLADNVPRLTEVATVPARWMPGDRIRIGFFSSDFRTHALQKLTCGLINRLDRSRFEVFVITDSRADDAGWQELVQMADRAVRIPIDLGTAAQEIIELRLHALVFPDGGMSKLSYFLPFKRLAALQCEMYFCPDRTCAPNTDYYVSSALYESEASRALDGAALVELSRPSCFYRRPPFPASTNLQQKLSLPPETTTYICPQSLFKMHPDMDGVFREILTQDPEGRLILLNVADPDWERAIRDRFARSLGDVIRKVHFYPKCSREEFLALLAAGDVLLDPFYYGGANTAYESLAMNALTVTLRSRVRQGRVLSGLYSLIGFPDLICDTPDQYVALAVSLGRDPQLRDILRRRLSVCSPAAFEDVAAVFEFEEFVAHAVFAKNRLA